MSLPEIFKDKNIINPTILVLALLSVAFGVAYYYLNNVSHLLIIHFTDFGLPDFLGDVSNVYGIIFSSFAAVVINLFLAWVLYYKIRFLSYFLTFFNIFLSILTLIAVGVIISVN